ncbi:MAG: isoamylase early set domain-containing protein [Deltaproteobacteria bacterium]|nr:isoamylase early set domain-containing protein [Deltaproteobacteria bacterium]
MKKTKEQKRSSDAAKRKTEFRLLAPRAQSVFLCGDFNRWNPSSHPLKKDNKGVWKISLNLDPGQYQYRFLVDGEWQNDPNCDSYSDNPFGTSNCLKFVG